MGSILVVLIILGCVAYQYLKGTLVRSLATLVIVVWGSVVAFGYFELLGGVFVGRGSGGSLSSFVLWAQALSFVLLFVLTFAILQTAANQLISKEINLELWPERIGRVCCGILTGLVLSGLLLTALAIGPLPSQYPYQRFDSTRPDVERPNKVLFNADGFATGWFSLISRGGMSGKRSFAALHPAFLDQLYLNRHAGKKVSIITGSEVIEVPRQNAVWSGPEDLTDTEGGAVTPRAGYNLTIVKVGIKKSILKQEGKFTLSQLRLICKRVNVLPALCRTPNGRAGDVNQPKRKQSILPNQVPSGAQGNFAALLQKRLPETLP